MSDEKLYDPWEKTTNRKSSAGVPALNDPHERENMYRPLRTEDLIPRHGRSGRPKIWLPDGSKMEYYGRPSGWGEVLDDKKRLAMYETRKTVAGYFDLGPVSDALQYERAALGPPDEDKEAHNRLNTKAKESAATADRIGSAFHALTERHDYGMDYICPPKFRADMNEWVRLTKFFKIVELESGPAIEVFVAMDEPRLNVTYPFGPYVDDHGNLTGEIIRLAGTFDRLWQYKPCDICGRRNYIGDLKGGQAASRPWSERKEGVQLGSYSRADQYIPHPDGKSAERRPLPDVCQHYGIIINIPTGGPGGHGSLHWVNIARGFRNAVAGVPWLMEQQRSTGWATEFVPVPDFMVEIDKCTTSAQIRDLWRQYPGEHWTDELVKYAGQRIESLSTEGVIA